MCSFFFFFSSRRRHTRYWRDWSSDVCSSDLTAFQNVRDAKLSRYLEKIARRAFETLRRRPRDHLQISDLGQARQNFFLNAIGKICVGRLATQIFERQYRDRFRWYRASPGSAGARAVVPNKK